MYCSKKIFGTILTTHWSMEFNFQHFAKNVLEVIHKESLTGNIMKFLIISVLAFLCLVHMTCPSNMLSIVEGLWVKCKLNCCVECLYTGCLWMLQVWRWSNNWLSVISGDKEGWYEESERKRFQCPSQCIISVGNSRN